MSSQAERPKQAVTHANDVTAHKIFLRNLFIIFSLTVISFNRDIYILLIICVNVNKSFHFFHKIKQKLSENREKAHPARALSSVVSFGKAFSSLCDGVRKNLNPPPCHCEEQSDVAISAAATISQSLRLSDHPDGVLKYPNPPPCHCEEQSDVAISAAATISQSLRLSDQHDGLRKYPNPHHVIARSAATWQSPRQRLYFNPYVFPTTTTGRAIKIAFYAKRSASKSI